MTTPPPPQTGVFVVSAWVEPEATPPVRARIRFTADVESTAATVVAAGSLDEVIAHLRAWWEALQSG